VEYYDVYVWDASPGRSFFILQRKLEEVIEKLYTLALTRPDLYRSLPVLYVFMI
jgi:hypothetical protein